ncbi:DUF2922 domain-containing protein [Atopobacter sp. AH10]|uniref:DUF2922 domain-containing protein n=1 Tax=Atopobacter sp. AH10 TaxID=2315861 RepID=UPI001314E1CA|nr:DUF2922 domain-containing protein [Atopobacter sp. AH10]
MKRTKNLVLKFKNAKGKLTNYTIRSPKEGLSEQVVRQAMEKIVKANISSSEGQAVFLGTEGAQYTERIVSKIF